MQGIKVFFLVIFLCGKIQSADEVFYLKAQLWEDPQQIDLSLSIINGTQKPPERIIPLTLYTHTGIAVPSLFFDRSSDVALIVGQGLPAPKEVMKVYAQLFSDYDVILFDYRWCNKYASSLVKAVLTGSGTKKILLDEEQEVRAVIDFLSNYKDYKKIVGLGECYSCFLFAKIQADDTMMYGKGPFTHLILDSCWHSLKSFADSISRDPYLPCNPTQGGAPLFIKKITNFPFLKWPLLKIIFWIISNVSIEPYLKEIMIPTLFVYGDEDLFVRKPHFQALWQATPEKYRALFLTPYAHADNLGNKVLYRFIAERFIESAQVDEFIKKVPILI